MSNYQKDLSTIDQEMKSCKKAVNEYLIRSKQYYIDSKNYHLAKLNDLEKMKKYEIEVAAWNNKWKYYRPMYLNYLKKAEFYAPCTGMMGSDKDTACRNNKGNVGAVGDWEWDKNKDSRGCGIMKTSPACRLKEDAISALMIKYDKDRGKPIKPEPLLHIEPVLVPFSNISCCGIKLSGLSVGKFNESTINEGCGLAKQKKIMEQIGQNNKQILDLNINNTNLRNFEKKNNESMALELKNYKENKNNLKLQGRGDRPAMGDCAKCLKDQEDYQKKGWKYNTDDFWHCGGCPHVKWP